MDKYIQLIFDVINNFITKINGDPNLLLLVNNFNIDGKFQNHILMNVIGVNKINLDISQTSSYVMHGDSYILQQKPETYQVLIAFHSMFTDKNFLKGFELLSHISSFFDNNKEFSAQNIPQIAEQNLESFFCNAKTFTMTEENEIWNKLKIPYMPTIFYEAGLLPVFSSVKFSQKKVASLKNF